MADRDETKLCATCGREFGWRKKWERNWGEVKYCSEACKRGVSREDREMEERILGLLEERERGATICPSEVARAMKEEGWQDLMESVRRAARRLVAAGKVDVTQGGKVVDAATGAGADPDTEAKLKTRYASDHGWQSGF